MAWYNPISWFTKSEEKPITLRRWEAGKTDRLNRAHWANVTGKTINQDLVSYLATLRTRCAYEAANNSFVEGVIFTHTNDVVGPHGPKLNVHTSNEAYRDGLETYFHKWWSMPDINGQLSGPDFLMLWNRSLWLNGEFLTQETVDMQSAGPVKLRLHNLDPRRLASPYISGTGLNVVMGIERNPTGKPEKYYIESDNLAQLYNYKGGSPKYEGYPADQIIHRYRQIEPNQARGVPWLAPTLQVIADLRDYDEQVMDAARAAADYCILLYTTHENAKYVAANEIEEIERRTMRTIPPGWEVMQCDPKQPSTKYVEYREEKHREIGRPVSMPLMIVRLDAGKHNFSSARFDGQLYQRGIDVHHGWLERGTLNPIVNKVAKELSLMRKIPPPPEDVLYSWTWTKVPHVDPKKEAEAQKIKMQNGTLSFWDACIEDGKDPEAVVNQRARDDEFLRKKNLPTVAESVGVESPNDDENENEGNQNGNQEE